MVQKRPHIHRKKRLDKNRIYDNKLKVFVKNLPDIENVVDVVKKHFDSCGNILDAEVYYKQMPAEKCTNVCVIFSSDEEAHQATLKTGTLIGGKHIIAFRYRQFANPTSSTVTVSNVSQDVTDEDLWQLFEESGTIKFIRIDRDKNSTSCQALIYFKDDESVNEAMKLEGKMLNGNAISVGPYEESTTKKQTKDKKEKFDQNLKVFVKNLPDNKKIEEIVKKQFNSCGTILDVHAYKTQVDTRKFTNVVVVFSSEEEADRATLQTGSVIEDRHIIVSKYRQYAYPTAKTVTVSNLSPDSTEEDLWNLFEKCGIKYIHIYRLMNVETCKADIHLKDEAGVKKALKRDGKTLNETVISVSLPSGDTVNDKTYPVFVSGLPTDIQKDQLTNEFKDCGIIRRVKISALKSNKQNDDQTQNATLFFVDEESVDKAVLQSGSSIAGYTYTVAPRQTDKVNEDNYTNPLYIAGIARETKDVDLFYSLQECGLFQKVTFVATPSRFLKKCVIEFKEPGSVKNALALKDVTVHDKKLILSDKKDIFHGEYPDTKACKRPASDESSEPTEKKKKKKAKKEIESVSDEVVDDTWFSSVNEVSEGKKKKKKRAKSESENLSESVVDEPMDTLSEVSEGKKKKKKMRKSEVTG